MGILMSNVTIVGQYNKIQTTSVEGYSQCAMWSGTADIADLFGGEYSSNVSEAWSN
jgi:hypothetical protein